MKQLTIFLLLTTLGAQADAVEVGGVQAGRVVVIGGDAIPLGSMLQAVGVQGGVAVHIAKPGETELTAALRTDPGILVHGLYPDSSSAAQARKFFQQSDCSGPVTALAWEHGQLPYASNFVDLLVVTRSEAQTSKGEWDRVLAPGGILLTNDRAFQIPAAFSPKQIPVPNWRAAVKPWPKGMDEWTHWYHSASGNAVGKDTLIGPPRRLQWTAGPKWSKSHNRNSTSFSSMVSADGRFFTIEDTTPASLLNVQAHWFLVARSAFNGVVLWRKELPSWNVRVWGEQTNSQAKKRLVAVGDRLYVPLGSDAPLSVLDAVTGKPIREYSEAPSPDEFVVHDGRIFLSDRDAVFALDAETGGRLWSRKDGREIAASGDTVCLFTDKGAAVTAVDAESGVERWNSPLPEGRTRRFNDYSGHLRIEDGVVVASAGERRDAYLHVFDVTNGRFLWSTKGGNRIGPILNGLMWSGYAGGKVKGLDLRTGEVAKEVPAAAMAFMGHHVRCYPMRACGNYILGNLRGAEFIDLRTGEVHLNNWIRGICYQGVVPANGMLYFGPDSCRCYSETMLRGLFALAPDDQSTPDVRGTESRLEKGPAYGRSPSATPPQASADSLPPDSNWPTFRHDVARSAATPSKIGVNLKPTWSIKLNGAPTAPVIAEGRVFLADRDRNLVFALSAETGETLWSYPTGGIVDTPPTWRKGRLLFGSADGWVTSLRADDGVLAWRVRVFPQRFVGVYGRIESAWPVHGTVLVWDDTAYFAAGRSSFLDGGMALVGVDAESGEIRFRKHFDGPWPNPEIGTTRETANRGFVISGASSDLLTTDGEHLYMRHLKLDPRLEKAEDMLVQFYPDPERKGENLGGDHKYWDNLLETYHHALETDPAWFHRGYYAQFPGHRLYATTGWFDYSWHIRSFRSYGQVVGQNIAFRDQRAYAVLAHKYTWREASTKAGTGYVVYAGATEAPSQEERRFALRKQERLWEIRLPLRPVAMALAGHTLVLAGPPDATEAFDVLDALEGRRGGRLHLVDAMDGSSISETELPGVPVFDGLAVAHGQLFVSMQNGHVMALGTGAQ